MPNTAERWSIDNRLVDPSNGQQDMDPILPGLDGRPYRGVPFDRKEGDPTHIQPKPGARVHVDVLAMNDVDDVKRMEEIYTMFCNGNAVISAEERHWDEEIKSWRIFIRWADLYVYNPQASNGGGR